MEPNVVGEDGFLRDMADETRLESEDRDSEGMRAMEQPLLVPEEGPFLSEDVELSQGFHLLYIARFLSAWGERMWEFGIALILFQLRPKTLLLPSIFGLVDSALLSLFGGAVGGWMDTVHVWSCFIRSVAFQNTMVTLSGASMFILLRTALSNDRSWFLLFVVMSILFGASSSLGSLGSKICLEKRLARALTRRDSHSLTKLNAGLRRIDLMCKIFAPGVAGLLLTHGNAEVCIIAIVSWNLIMWIPEYLCIQQLIYGGKYEFVEEECKPHDAPKATRNHSFRTLVGTWKCYFSQEVTKAALSLAFLYFTVLSFGSVMVPYLYSRGMSETTLGIYRGIGAAFGIIATLSLSPLTQKIGLLWTGLVGIYMQLFCLAVGAAGIFLGASELISTHMLVVGVVLSRWGLWTFDLVVSQLIQEKVDRDKLSGVSGVQNSIQNVLQLGCYLTSCILSHPNEFGVLSALSVTAVACASILYTVYFACE